LTSVGAIRKIVETALECGAEDPANVTVLEVGPGNGILTEALLKNFKKVIAVEKDERLASLLKEKFEKEIRGRRLKIFTDDILGVKPRNLGIEFPSEYAIIANIPYYITGQFLRQWLSISPWPKYMVLMLQKEVAKRIVARDGKESLLSISVKVYGEPRYIQTVKRGSFFPTPRVDSAILKIDHISKEFFSNLGANLPNNLEKRFFSLVRAGFSHKRKLLSSNLKKTFILTRFNLSEIGVDPRSRAEDLRLEDWKCLLGQIIHDPVENK